MKKEEIINYKIDSDVLKKYVETINSIKEPMSKIKDELNQISKPIIVVKMGMCQHKSRYSQTTQVNIQ